MSSRHRIIGVFLLVTASIAGVSAQPTARPNSGHPPSAFEMAAASLPPPPAQPGEAARPCARIGKDPALRMRYASPEVEQSMTDAPQFKGLHAVLNMWASRHVPGTTGCWTDSDLVVSRFQAAVGNPVTGVLAAEDVGRLTGALAAARAVQGEERNRQAAAQAEVDKLRASGVRVLGIVFGAPLDLPQCPALRWGEFPTQACQKVVGNEVYVELPRSELPAWINQGSLYVRLYRGVVESLHLSPSNWGAAMRVMNERFGEAGVRTQQYENGFGAAFTVTDHSWSGEGLVARTSCRYGSTCRDQIQIISQAVAQARAQDRNRQEVEQTNTGRKF